jgi:hypothetical protein
MALITNKYKRNATGEWGKHPRPSLKRYGNKKLRKDDTFDEIEPKYKKKPRDKKFKRPRLCPICLDDIYVQYLGKAIKMHGTCKKCGAQKVGNRKCPQCKSKNVWKRENIYKCKQCGKEF